MTPCEVYKGPDELGIALSQNEAIRDLTMAQVKAIYSLAFTESGDYRSTDQVSTITVHEDKVVLRTTERSREPDSASGYICVLVSVMVPGKTSVVIAGVS